MNAEQSTGRKVSSSVAVVAAVFLLLVVVDLLTGGFGVGIVELTVLGVVLAVGLVWVWWPRRA
jgi:hypothetical protein